MESNLAVRLLETTVMWTAPIGMIILVVYLIMDIKGVMAGQNSIGKILVKVLCIFLLIGIMFAANSFENFGNIFKGITEDVITEDNLPNIGK